MPKEKTDELTTAISELKNKIKLCQFCFNPFESPEAEQDKIGEGPAPANLCAICSNPRRDKSLLCVVEKEADLLSIENVPNPSGTQKENGAKKYNGLYFILGGTLPIVGNNGHKGLRIEELKDRTKKNNFSEIIIALNPTPEGRATSALIEKQLKEGNPTFKITHLAKGIPFGGELEYADEETLESAFEGRK